jgi:copper(I)-binding protein
MLCALCVFAGVALLAPAAAAQNVKVANAWARATAPGQKTASVYFEITSDANAALVAAGTAFAERAELHSMTIEDGVMRMRSLPRIDLPAGQVVRLTPNGMHVMLVALKQPLKPGDRLPLQLSIQSSGTSLTTLKTEAEVRSLDGSELHKH